MLQKIKNVLGYFRPQKLTEIEKEFIRLNTQFWSKGNIPSDHAILIEGHITCPASIIDKARMAKAIEEITGYDAVVFLRGFYEKGNSAVDIYRSFNICKFYMWWAGFLRPTIFIPAIVATIMTMIKCRDGRSLIGLKYKGVEIGDLIYDTLIRYKLNSYTVKKLNVSHLRLIFRAFLTFHNNQFMIKKFKPKYLVTSHNVYAEFGMLPRQLKHHCKSVIFLKDIYAYKCYGANDDLKVHFLKPSFKDFEKNYSSIEYINKAKEYVSARFSGAVDQIDVKNAFLGKRKYDFEELMRTYPELSKEKKNIVVMSHAFSDAPHVGEGLLFADYYDFLEQTLCFLNTCTDINCFVKPHPSSYMWNEKGAVEEMIERNQLSNIFITPSDFNTNSIAEFADCIITAKGTAGLEFSCLGIPAITAGRGYYSGFGITPEPDSVTEYMELLSIAHTLPRLNQEEINRAVVLLYMVATNRRHTAILPKQHIMPGENYEEVFEGKYAEVIENIQKGAIMKDEFFEEVKLHAAENHV